MEGLDRYAGYKDYKAAFDAEVQRTELGFVRIGYMLRVAQDTDILRESGYAGMEEFAWKEYRIDKSQASRFIGINRRFSVDGYSDELCEGFQGYGVAKLGEMLSLSDEVIGALPEQMTRTEIQEIKREIREEQKISGLEVLMEAPPPQEGRMLEAWMAAYYRERPREFLRIRTLYGARDGAEAAMELLAPSGQAALMARIPGAGKHMLAIRGKDRPLELLDVRTNGKEAYSWEECIQALARTCPEEADPKEAYEAAFHIPFPEEKPEVAPVQPPQKAEREQGKPHKDPVAEAVPPQEGPVQEASGTGTVSPGLEGPPQGLREADSLPVEEPQQMEIGYYTDAVLEPQAFCHDIAEAAAPEEPIRDEGARLAEEVRQWMRTGTAGYLPEMDRMVRRLQEIVKELMEHEEHT